MTSVKKFDFEDTFLSKAPSRVKYEPGSLKNDNLQQTTVHIGQLKLFISEVNFFNMFLEDTDDALCVYAGAAPGIHIPFLSKMFPMVTFHLYDPSKFGIEQTDKIRLFQEPFTNQTADKYKDRNVYFFSDIRTVNRDVLKEKALKERGIQYTVKNGKIELLSQFEEGETIDEQVLEQAENDIQADNEMQKEWVEIMKPKECLLKFHLPFFIGNVDKKIKYFAGIVYFQPFVGLTSTETRLKPIKNSRGDYIYENWSVKDYEEVLAYHNTSTRKTRYINPFTGTLENITGDDLRNDYDCTNYIFILTTYLKRFTETYDKESVLRLEKDILQDINARFKRYYPKANFDSTETIGQRREKSYNKYQAKLSKK
jgi:hypothetical protein